MQTPLTILFPAGYAFNETECGNIDAVGVVSPDDGHIEPIAGPVSSADTLAITGWAMDGVSATLAAGVLITLGDRIIEATYGLPRPDVAGARGNDALLRSGFSARLAAAAGTAGATPLTAFAVSADGTAVGRVGATTVLEMRRADAEVTLSLPRRAGFAAYHLDSVRAVDASGIDATAAPLLLVRRGAAIEVRGWAFDMLAAQSVRGVYLVVDGRDFVRGTLGYARQDVAEANRNRALRDCGFAIRFDTSGLVAGSHRLALGFIAFDGEAWDEVVAPSELVIV